jgi:hypothetical protein
MASDLATRGVSRPTRDQLLADFGDEYLSIQSLFQFCFVPGGRLSLLKELTPVEEWGMNNFVLLKYLAVHIRLSIEQGRYVWNGDQVVLTAGRLFSLKGVPLYIGLVRNSTPDENPWVLNWVGERPSTAELPEPADLGDWPVLDPRNEVVIACDFASEERRSSVPSPNRRSSCRPAIAGAVTGRSTGASPAPNPRRRARPFRRASRAATT